MALNTITNTSAIATASGLPTGTFINYFNELVRAVKNGGGDFSGLQDQIDKIKEIIEGLVAGTTDPRVDQLINQMDYVLDALNALSNEQQSDYYADIINLKTQMVITRAELIAWEGFVIILRGDVSRLKVTVEDHEERIVELEKGGQVSTGGYVPIVLGGFIEINEQMVPRFLLNSRGDLVYGRMNKR